MLWKCLSLECWSWTEEVVLGGSDANLCQEVKGQRDNNSTTCSRTLPQIWQYISCTHRRLPTVPTRLRRAGCYWSGFASVPVRMQSCLASRVIWRPRVKVTCTEVGYRAFVMMACTPKERCGGKVCCALNCTNNRYKCPGMTFFTFPKEEAR